MSVRLAVCLDLEGDDADRFRAYLEENRAFIVRISEDAGCGCCVSMYDLEVSEAAGPVPPGLARTNAWTRDGRPPRRFVPLDELLADWP